MKYEVTSDVEMEVEYEGKPYIAEFEATRKMKFEYNYGSDMDGKRGDSLTLEGPIKIGRIHLYDPFYKLVKNKKLVKAVSVKDLDNKQEVIDYVESKVHFEAHESF